MAIKGKRSALYIPASNERAIGKIASLACDIVILDLEDAVAPDRKSLARTNAVAAFTSSLESGREAFIRINAIDSEEFEQDVLALRQTTAPVVVPKVNCSDDLRTVARHLPDRPIWAMIETCLGVQNINGIAGESRNLPLAGLIIGANDLAKEMFCRLDRSRRPIWPALSMAVMAARANGLDILDAVFNRIKDQEGFETECAEGVEFGFDGKTLIHPTQIEPCNRIFSPDADDIAWAERVVSAFSNTENASVNALNIDGQMVERLHLASATRVLSRR
ncbi:HpcH/HpaI aldolase/citrate lyase family protein [Aureimonas frigidaquae]|uniref:Citryl-CoA lyase n=1 Tax=Aureimonas frigidaquae TaxID=424757 RepID=A0A0P0Z0G7_9HYPH|nr:CoA ester lyase [Aureimonas frigidaquae]BAT27379.1 citryl-CoA lyase [Aureimonas frigidaquae]